jgi:outer membrane protein insertion porin family
MKIHNTHFLRHIILLVFSVLSANLLLAQSTTQDSIPITVYSDVKTYEIGGVTVTGNSNSDPTALISMSGLRVGKKVRIPGTDISKAVKSLWNLRLFTDVQILKVREEGEIAYLEINVTERPRYNAHVFKGAKKAQHDDLNKIVNKYLIKGSIVTEGAKTTTTAAIDKFFKEKGYLDVVTEVNETKDATKPNSVRLEFDVARGSRVKIQNITFTGNKNVVDSKLRKLMEKTKRKTRLFASSKLLQEEYKKDKKKIIDFYNTIGFRDAAITKDSIWREADGDLQVHLTVSEGRKYYFRHIGWKGNTIYDNETLDRVLGIKKGDVYNDELLEKRLRFSQDSRDISSLYMDNGYLFFNVDPVETAIEGDSIDLDIKLFEGPQATIDKVIIEGNDRTHEHVIRREVRTVPGQKFSRSDIIRSQREIAALNYFNPETLKINPIPNPQRGTVDIQYKVDEKPSDQLELSAGYQPANSYYKGGLIGTLGVTFNNFSVRNIFKKESWHPLPQGDGQRLSLRAQGQTYFRTFTASFVEPWLGGKKPTSFSLSSSISSYTPNVYANSDPSVPESSYNTATVSLGLGTRLKFPDDNFISNTSLNYQRISLLNFASYGFVTDDNQRVSTGTFNGISLTQTVARNSISDPLFPMSGSKFELTATLTPPAALFGVKSPTNGASLDPQARFQWLEYHKWRFKSEWYTSIVGKLTLKAGAKLGFLGYYDKNKGKVPFERFELTSQFAQFNVLSREFVFLRGYDSRGDYYNRAFPANSNGASVFNKYALELRYPISLSPTSTIFALGFVEGANVWDRFKDFNPFEVRRSAGVGLRVFLPMFGLIGFDYGFGLDRPDLIDAPSTAAKNRGAFSFFIGVEPE